MPLHLLQIAKKLAHDAGMMALDYQKKGVKIETKGSHVNLVTEADRACEKLIMDTILKNFPDHTIVSEESEIVHGNGDYKWIIDPIDGTTNFAHGSPYFGVSIAIIKKGKPIIGIVEVPALGEGFWAKEGEGAHLGRHRISVSQTGDLKDALLATGLPYNRESERWKKAWELQTEYHKYVRGIRRMGAAAVDLAYVAAGRFDAFFEYDLKPWDVAAGKIIIEEAGGVVSNMDGTPLNPKLENIVASNGVLHPQMLKSMNQLGADKL